MTFTGWTCQTESCININMEFRAKKSKKCFQCNSWSIAAWKITIVLCGSKKEIYWSPFIYMYWKICLFWEIFFNELVMIQRKPPNNKTFSSTFCNQLLIPFSFGGLTKTNNLGSLMKTKPKSENLKHKLNFTWKVSSSFFFSFLSDQRLKGMN